MSEVDRDNRDGQGLSPAMHTLYRGETEEAESLVPDEPNVFEAAAFGHAERLGELLESDPGLARAFSGDGFTALHLAAFFGHPEAVRLLLDRGADPNAVATSEQIGPVQPLHSAAAEAGWTASGSCSSMARTWTLASAAASRRSMRQPRAAIRSWRGSCSPAARTRPPRRTMGASRT
jgi:hypothetical protein